MNDEHKHYFESVELSDGLWKYLAQETSKTALGNTIYRAWQHDWSVNLSDFDIAIIGVGDDRTSANSGCGHATSVVREFLFRLFSPIKSPRLVDLGNIKRGNKTSDTYVALRDMIKELRLQGITTIVIGGGGELMYGMYMGYESLSENFNMVSIDSRLNVGNAEDVLSPDNFLSRVVLDNSHYLFNFTNLGYQSYFVSPLEIEAMDKLTFDYVRLGTIRNDIGESEPILRDADIVGINIRSVRQADAPGYYQSSPNGFFAHELCTLARFAGISDRVSCVGIFDVNPWFDSNHQTAHLAAQTLWHFIEGFALRPQDYPATLLDNYTKYVVDMPALHHQLTFYKSPKTGRWWIELPMQYRGVERKIVVACSQADYETACRQDIPERWWKFFEKL